MGKREKSLLKRSGRVRWRAVANHQPLPTSRGGGKEGKEHHLKECIVLRLEVPLRLFFTVKVAQVHRLAIFVGRVP